MQYQVPNTKLQYFFQKRHSNHTWLQNFRENLADIYQLTYIYAYTICVHTSFWKFRHEYLYYYWKYIVFTILQIRIHSQCDFQDIPVSQLSRINLTL